jgi:ABC-type sugar transport system ATPase subunit
MQTTTEHSEHSRTELTVERAPAIRVADVALAFGATRALRACSFDVRCGEVHAIIGENGSGKSTLVKVLGGVHTPDAGHLERDGVAVRALSPPRKALALGIVPVYQEVLVVGPQSVLDNVWMGADGLLRRRVPEEVKRQRARRVLAELLGDTPGLETPVETLSLSERQACTIARALLRDPQVLILDEATSALDIATRDRLFAVVARLRAEGRSVVFISHRMDEIGAIADRVTVLRSGETVATVSLDATSSDELVRLMTGDEIDREIGAAARTAEARIGNEIVLCARGVKVREGADAVDLDLRAGELVGLAGLEGHGQDTFLRALWGAGALEGSVVRTSGGESTPVRSPAHAAALGIAYVPRDRRAESLFLALSIRENFTAPTAGADARLGVVRAAHAERRFAGFRDRLRIALASSRAPVWTLSGGNQQKVVIARWLAGGPRILLLNDPTRGVDMRAKGDIYALLTELAHEGVAVVMLSTELDEHVELMDRVLVFREGTVFRELARDQASRAAIVASFFGQEIASHA